MRVGTVNAQIIRGAIRFDSKFFLDTGNAAFARVSSGKWPLTTPLETFGRDNVWMPNRFVRVYAANETYGKPLLVPYDCFRYLPASRSFLSASQVSEYGQTELKRGWLLVVRSGRNLGPTVMVDAYLERFSLSDDMIRISVPMTDASFYFLALLSSRTGQALIRRDRNGSVIDHLGPEQIVRFRYPIAPPTLFDAAVSAFRQAFELREAARFALEKHAHLFLGLCGIDLSSLQVLTSRAARRYSIDRSSIVDRFDAEPHAPSYEALRDAIARSGSGKELDSVAEVHKPSGRYKTLYVVDESYGVKMMSGRQIAQFLPIGLKVMSPAALDDPEAYVLKKDDVLLTADGRAEDNLADCVLVRDDRAGWAASGHVHRLYARADAHPGLLYLACSSYPVQLQLKALATGSVVDALSDSDVASVMVPFPRGAEARDLGDEVVRAWDWFALASELETKAAQSLDAEFLQESA